VSEPRIRGLPDVRDREGLRSHVLAHGPFDPATNERIYDERFARAPRHLFRAVDDRYGISTLRLCDVGCGYGENLVFSAPGSFGLELEPECVAFATALGLDVRPRDVLHDDLSELPKAQAVWCSALLEHVESTHVLLRRLHFLLEPNGLLAVYVPTIPVLPQLSRLPKLGPLVGGYRHSDHVNAFVPSTLRFACERAGFETLQVSALLPGPLAAIERFPPVSRLIGLTVYVGRAIPDWDYPENAARRAVDGGFDYVGWASRSLARGDDEVRETEAEN